MTSPTQLAQERRIAMRCLPHFGLAHPKVRLIKIRTTSLFRVSDGHQRQFVLRIQPTQRMPLHAVQAELAWLTTLREQTDLRVPEPVRTPAGELVGRTHSDTPDDERLCALFHWIPGRHKHHLLSRDAALLGSMLGTLHHFASTYPLAASLARWRFDSAAFAEQVKLLDLPTDNILSANNRAMLRYAAEYVLSHLTILDTQPGSIGLIHADTNLTNWLFQRDHVALLDFEVCCFGYYIFDIGRLLHEFEASTVAIHDLVASFQRAYIAARPLPAWHDEQIMAGKLMSLLDVVLWAMTLEPWVRQAWGEYRIHAALAQIQHAVDQIR